MTKLLHLLSIPILSHNLQLQFHPTSPSLLLSTSTDGLLSLIDISLDSSAGPDDALLQVVNHAGFLSSGVAYALSHDERLAFYEMEGGEEVTGKRSGDGNADEGREGEGQGPLGSHEFGDVRSKIGQCGYVVNLWRDERQDGVAVMAVGNSEYVRAYSFAPFRFPKFSLNTVLFHKYVCTSSTGYRLKLTRFSHNTEPSPSPSTSYQPQTEDHGNTT